MKIEIATDGEHANKAKGDLLEALAHDLLATQNYELFEQVRLTGAEYDLLARHPVNGRTIYVECKAYRNTLSSNAIFNLKGKTDFRGYSEGWLVSAGPFGKDAKGTIKEWEERPQQEREKLSFYSPNRVIMALVAAKLIALPKDEVNQGLLAPGTTTIDWTLALTEFGRFWLAPVLHSGLPKGVRVLSASDCSVIQDIELLSRLQKLDTSYQGLNFLEDAGAISAEKEEGSELPPVVEIQEAETWRDYRPSRPKDFVGRFEEQDQITSLLRSVGQRNTSLRAFAITGGTGMGKSSLVAKLRATSRSRNYRNKTFVFAVDCRAAEESSYINASLLKGLREAAREGFGDIDPNEIRIENNSDPVSSPSINRFLMSLEEGTAICVIFDQFEELYSRTELYEVFNEAKKLLISASAAQTSLICGFVWRSDATIPLDHPAYHFWHQLKEQRLEVVLRPLVPADVGKAITIFEREVSGKLRPDVRQQVIENSQGYPWLLKEICINLQEQIEKGDVSPEAIETLEVDALFEEKLRLLQPAENTCIRHVANNSPADWTELLELFGHNTVLGLQEKKYLLRSGDRAVVYWDVFRDFLISGTPPVVPISYLPAVSVSSAISVGCALNKSLGKSHANISAEVGLSEGTVGNVVRDLRMFGLASGDWAEPKLSVKLEEGSPEAIARQIRRVFQRHSVCDELLKVGAGKTISNEEFLGVVSASPSLRTRNAASVRQAGNRLSSWLSTAGFVKGVGPGWVFEDFGSIDLSFASRKRRDWGVFNGSAPPHRALEVLRKVMNRGILPATEINQPGYEKALNLLSRFELIVQFENSSIKPVSGASQPNSESAVELLHSAAQRQASIKETVFYLRANPGDDGKNLARHLAAKFGEDWAEGSLKRTGNALKRWGEWLIDCKDEGQVIEPIEGTRGKPRGDTPEMMRNIQEMLDAGMTKKMIAEKVGRSVAAVHIWLKRQAQAAEERD